MTKWTGDHAFLFDFRGAATPVMVPPANDVLSARQKLPFVWKFFRQPVDGYLVSDNLTLYENGEFETTFASGRTGAPLRATIGAVAADGKTAILAEGPSFDYPSVGYGGADDVSYKFTPGVK